MLRPVASIHKHEWQETFLYSPRNRKVTVCRYCGTALRPGQNDVGLCGGVGEGRPLPRKAADKAQVR